MTIRSLKKAVPDYSAHDFVGNVSFNQYYFNVAPSVKVNSPDPVKKLDHSVSNLPNAPLNNPPMSRKDVILRAALGEFGSTEVPPNQIW